MPTGEVQKKQDTERGRGVQYLHCVMHKCIMVKLGGKQKTHEVCNLRVKNHVNFTKSEEKFGKGGEIGGNVLIICGNSKFIVDD